MDEIKYFPKRKPTRLKGYDYSQNGAYFITICTDKRKCILGNIVGQGQAPALQYPILFAHLSH